MAENDIDHQDVDLVNNEEAEEPSEEAEAQPEPTERVKELEAEVAKYKRIAERNAKKAEKTDSPKEEPVTDKKKSTDLDYGQKAFLRSYDIKGSDELELVKGFAARTGEDLESVVEDDIFQAKLNKLREARAATEAVPKSSKRTNKPATDDVSYWQAKIAAGTAQLNDIEDVGLRRKVLNAKIAAERGPNFSSTPIL